MPLQCSRLFLFVLALAMFLPHSVVAQNDLRRMTVEQQTSDRILVFANHPDKAAVVVVSSIPNLRIDSNLGIVADQSEIGTGEYRIILEPSRQIIYIDAPGFIRATFQMGNLNPRDVIYLSVEPEDRSITDTGVLIIRTRPEGATIRIAGIPGEFRSPYTFDPILAQTHSIQVEMEGYETQNVRIRVEPNRPTIETIHMDPNAGFLQVNAEETQLFLRSGHLPTESRVSFNAGHPFVLGAGDYEYRLVRQYYMPVLGRITIGIGETVQLNPVFEPNFGEIHVRANVPQFRVSANDNMAPAPQGSSMLYLEPGIREIQVSAEGYQEMTFRVRVASGQRIDTTLTLISMAEVERLRQLEALPRGVLELNSDLSDSRILVNGEYKGTGSVTLSLIPGTYRVEYQHEIGRIREVIYVPSAQLVSHDVVLRPSRSRAVALSAIFPGGGLIYTKRKRGYIYLGLTAAALGYTYYWHKEYLDYESRYEAAVVEYRRVNNYEAAILARQRAETIHKQQVQAYDRRLMALGVAAGIHLLQNIDVRVSSPKFGYRENHSLSIVPELDGRPALAYRISF